MTRTWAPASVNSSGTVSRGDARCRLCIVAAQVALEEPHDGLGARVQEVARLALAQLGGGLRLHQVVDAGGAAAELPLGRLDQVQPWNRAQQLAWLGAHALGMREMAGVVVGQLQL